VARGVERGDIWLYRFGKPDKKRPVLILSRPAALALLRTAIVAPITTTIHGVPSELRVGTADGLKADSAVNFDHLYTVEQVELRQFIGHLDERRMRAACMALEIALGC
jgi:mRNA interferase MazF